jgi:hypothetical protein
VFAVLQGNLLLEYANQEEAEFDATAPRAMVHVRVRVRASRVRVRVRGWSVFAPRFRWGWSVFSLG